MIILYNLLSVWSKVCTSSGYLKASQKKKKKGGYLKV